MLAWKQGRISANEVLSALSPMLRRLSRWAADKYKVNGFADDIYQELAIALVGDAGKKWNPKQPIFSYMAGWAWRIASSMEVEISRESSYDELYQSTESEVFNKSSDREIMDWKNLIADENTPENFVIEKELNDISSKPEELGISLSVLDRELARVDSSLKTSARKGVQERVGTQDNNEDPPKRKYQSRKKIMVVNQRLLTLRNSVGFTRADMASALGLTLSRYAAFESGKIKSVPESIYQQAESLAQNASWRVRASKEIEDLPMSRIIDLWCSKLGIDDPMELAKILDVSSRTMRRWMTDEYKPKNSIVIYHHLQVHDYLQKN